MQPKLDGRLDKPFWEAVPWTDDFIDIQGAHMPAPRYRTRAKMQWSKEFLFIGALLEEPDVWATLKDHDSVIFHDNDFEVFIDPDGDNHLYAEFEMNALNTTWDLLLVMPYRNGGPAIDGFELHGIQTAVHIDGTLNDPFDRDHGWSVEIAIPWSAFKDIARMPLPPNDGDQWRINFSRVEWHLEREGGRYKKVEGRAEDNWVWSPQGVIDMHRPEMWGIVQFSDTAHAAVKEYPGMRQREKLMSLYNDQQTFRQAHKKWAAAIPGYEDVEISIEGDFWRARYDGWQVDYQSRLTKTG